MRPPESGNFERVKIGDFVTGIIDDVQYEKEHEFTFEGATIKAQAIRFKLLIEDCQYPKYTRWMKFNLSARSNLFKRFVSALVAGATPNMDFDLDELKGFTIKLYYTESEKGFQNIELVKPFDEKLIVTVVKAVTPEPVVTTTTPVQKPSQVKAPEVKKELEFGDLSDDQEQDSVDFSNLP